MKVYISGPMTGLDQNNYPAFFDMAEHLCRIGFDPINPAAQPEQPTWEQYMRQDIKLLMDADMMVMLPGWEESKGAKIEKQIAEAMNFPIAYGQRIGPKSYAVRISPVTSTGYLNASHGRFGPEGKARTRKHRDIMSAGVSHIDLSTPEGRAAAEQCTPPSKIQATHGGSPIFIER